MNVVFRNPKAAPRKDEKTIILDATVRDIPLLDADRCVYAVIVRMRRADGNVIREQHRFSVESEALTFARRCEKGLSL